MVKGAAWLPFFMLVQWDQAKETQCTGEYFVEVAKYSLMREFRQLRLSVISVLEWPKIKSPASAGLSYELFTV